MAQEEILQCFDEARNPTEGRPRSIVKAKPNRYWYGITCIWVVNNAGQILCSKRALHLAANPGRWASFFGGHVKEKETFIQTAINELAEESGISAHASDLFLIEATSKPEEKVFIERYAILYNKPTIDLTKTDGEVDEVRWMSMDEQWQEQEKNPDMWCSPCRPHHQQLIREWLAIQIK